MTLDVIQPPEWLPPLIVGASLADPDDRTWWQGVCDDLAAEVDR